MKTTIETSSIPGREAVLAGVRRTFLEIVELDKRDDEDLVIVDSEDKPVRVKARDL